MLPRRGLRRCIERDWFVLVAVLAWKVALLTFTAQPIPTSDAFFYDGPVVNYLNGGRYCNPSVSVVLPISGTEVFTAYPPFYQGVLWLWMSLFGTSALSAMWLQALLFAAYAVGIVAVFRRFEVKAIWVNLGCLFLLANTFNDRPDTLAFALGTWALYAWLQARPRAQNGWSSGWNWVAAVLVVLTLGTSLQIGLLFVLWSAVWLAVSNVKPQLPVPSFPWLPMAAVLIVPTALVLVIKLWYPRLWEGFAEHLRESPTLVGWQMHSLALFESYFLKLLRTVPAIMAIPALIALLTIAKPQLIKQSLKSDLGRFMLVSLAMLPVLAGVTLILFIPTAVLWAAYLQPLVIGLFTPLLAAIGLTDRQRRLSMALFLALALLGAVRALGISTWGVLCATDVSYSGAMKLVRDTLNSANSPVALSSAYLYEAAKQPRATALHADWLAPYRHGSGVVEGLISLKPQYLVLTQFDYYRRFQILLEQLKLRPELREMRINDTAKVRPPDAYPSMQKVVQHVSWAPIIVELSWK